MTLKGEPALMRRFAALGSGHGTRQLMGQLGLLAVREAKALAPRKTGNLQRSIRLGTVSERGAQIVAGGLTNIGYAAFVEYGTKAHDISPRHKKVLRFASSPGGRRLSGSPRRGAGVVFARRVRHPGTKAHSFLRQGAVNALARTGLGELLIKAWNDAA
jgi:hypothetical protein